jgi:hypothetical protein
LPPEHISVSILPTTTRKQHHALDNDNINTRKMGTLSKVPVEVRQMIFKLYLENSWSWRDAKTPALIVALRARGELALYFEALEAFQKTNVFTLHAGNIGLFLEMPVNARCNIRLMSIRSVPPNSRKQD